jgi:hypothetical protein
VALAGFHAEVRNARQVSGRIVCRVYDIGEVTASIFSPWSTSTAIASLLRHIGRLPADNALKLAGSGHSAKRHFSHSVHSGARAR